MSKRVVLLLYLRLCVYICLCLRVHIYVCMFEVCIQCRVVFPHFEPYRAACSIRPFIRNGSAIFDCFSFFDPRSPWDEWNVLPLWQKDGSLISVNSQPHPSCSRSRCMLLMEGLLTPRSSFFSDTKGQSRKGSRQENPLCK